jgi:hypothetical protein
MPPRRPKAKHPELSPPDDPCLEIAWDIHEKVCFLHGQFAKEWPVMLYDVQEQRIYAYPYGPFAADLSQKSQRSLAQQYRAACADGCMVLFIRDNVKRKLKSYTMPI